MNYNTSTSVPKKIYNSITGKWTNTNVTSGDLFVDIKDNKQDYTFKVVYQLNQFYDSKEYTAQKTVKAFHQAINFDAQPAENGGTLLTWKIANNEATCEESDNFEI